MGWLTKLSLPVTILLGSVILGSFYYATQINKQESIERQQRIERETQTKQQELSFKQKECEALSDGVMRKWNNVMGVTYNEAWGECVVTFTDLTTGEVETSALSSMKTVK